MRAVLLCGLVLAVGCDRAKPVNTDIAVPPPVRASTPAPKVEAPPPKPAPALTGFDLAWAKAVELAEAFEKDEPAATAKRLERLTAAERARAAEWMREVDRNGLDTDATTKLREVGLKEWLQAACVREAKHEPQFRAMMKKFYPHMKAEYAPERISTGLRVWPALGKKVQGEVIEATSTNNKKPSDLAQKWIANLGGDGWLAAP